MSGRLGDRDKQVEGVRHQAPPGPKGLPVLGSLFQARKNPLGFAHDLLEEYGDIVNFKIGFYTGYLLNHPNYFRYVLNTNKSNYSKENYNYEKLKPVLGEGLITSNGDTWARHRRMIQPIFRSKHLEKVAKITARATGEKLKKWSRQTITQPVNIGDEMMNITLKVVTNSLFSMDISSSLSTVKEAFTTLNEDIAYRFKHVFVSPLWIPTKRNRTFKRARRELNRLVYKIIEQRQRDKVVRNDLLDSLLSAGEEKSRDQGLTVPQIRDEVMTLLLAGHETTANLLTWTCYLLSQHPSVTQRLRIELDEVLQGREPVVGDLSALEYLKMVIQESLRLYPPVWIISRKAINRDVIDGYTIPKGSTVTLCIYTLHRHPDFWVNPLDFNPERFSNDHDRDRHPYAFLPFGGGPRSCIGKHFAMVEAQIILAMLLQRYHLKPVDSSRAEPEALVTLRPRNGLRIKLEPV